MPVTRPRLLVVDDNATWRETISGILEADHELVGTVVRGDEIMESAERLCPDVITLDVSLPGMSGLNVLPRLRKACPRAIIVIVSATATPSIERKPPFEVQMATWKSAGCSPTF